VTVAACKSEKPLLPEAEFIAGFHAIGEERYHHKHPFHLLMHEGKLTRGQLQAWALNRYYYQSRIPIKDAAILARSEDPAFRLAWRKRILDHDGDVDHQPERPPADDRIVADQLPDVGHQQAAHSVTWFAALTARRLANGSSPCG